jgi:signal transduction histidine kinase
VQGHPEQAGDGVRYVFLPIDLHGLNHAQNLLAVEKTLVEMLARGEPQAQMLNALSRGLEQLCDGSVCGVLLVAADRNRFELGSDTSLPSGFVGLLEGVTVDGGHTPYSLAVIERIPIVAGNLGNDPRWRSDVWSARIRALGFSSCYAAPIVSAAGDVSGVVAVHKSVPLPPTVQQKEIIHRFAQIAGIAIDGARADASIQSRERALRQGQAQLSEIQRLTTTGSYSWLVDTDELCVSEEFRRILGIDHLGPVKPQQLWDRAHPDDVPLVLENTEAALAGNDTDYVFRARMQDGSIKYLRSFARCARMHDGRRELVGLVTDVTASKLAEETLGQLRSQLAHVARVATLNAMTASIGHEVSQPLAGILTNANTCLRMLAADPPNIAGAAETARRTIRDADRASEVIRHLRRMFSAKAPTMEAVDLNDAAREVIALSAGELRRNGTILREDYAHGLPRVAADRVQLQQVILNLLLNGAEAMDEVEGRPKDLLVQTNRIDDGSVELRVRDSGVGLDPRTVEKLFEAFYTTKPQGMGVGLSISRSIIERHDGRLWAEAHEGPGATFSFCIPGIAA